MTGRNSWQVAALWLAHPRQPTRVQLRAKVAQIFSRTPNGCGHRQVAMCLRAEEGVRIADKTVLKMMRQMGLRCGIRRERAYRKYNSYKGLVEVARWSGEGGGR